MSDPSAATYCYLTTTGRVTGRPHTIEIWFALEERTAYLLSGGAGSADWVQNILRSPRVTLRIGDRSFSGRGRVITDHGEEARARRLVHDKYQPGYGGDLSGWRRSALPIAVDLNDAP